MKPVNNDETTSSPTGLPMASDDPQSDGTWNRGHISEVREAVMGVDAHEGEREIG